MKKKLLVGSIALVALAISAGLGFATFDDPAPDCGVGSCLQAAHLEIDPEHQPERLFVSTALAADPAAEPPTEGNLTLLEGAADPPKLGELLNDISELGATWKAVGLLASLIALVTLLVKITKFGFVGLYIKKKRLEWVRPLLGMCLAGLAAASGAQLLGIESPWWWLGGVIAGLSAPGAHEFFESVGAMLSKKKREKLTSKAAAGEFTKDMAGM